MLLLICNQYETRSRSWKKHFLVFSLCVVFGKFNQRKFRLKRKAHICVLLNSTKIQFAEKKIRISIDSPIKIDRVIKAFFSGLIIYFFFVHENRHSNWLVFWFKFENGLVPLCSETILFGHKCLNYHHWGFLIEFEKKIQWNKAFVWRIFGLN